MLYHILFLRRQGRGAEPTGPPPVHAGAGQLYVDNKHYIILYYIILCYIMFFFKIVLTASRGGQFQSVIDFDENVAQLFQVRYL
jgi:hypothetical protein